MFNLLPEISFQWLISGDRYGITHGWVFGERLSFLSKPSENGRYVFISVTEAHCDLVSVTLGLWLLGLPMGLPFLLVP